MPVLAFSTDKYQAMYETCQPVTCQRVHQFRSEHQCRKGSSNRLAIRFSTPTHLALSCSNSPPFICHRQLAIIHRHQLDWSHCPYKMPFHSTTITIRPAYITNCHKHCRSFKIQRDSRAATAAMVQTSVAIAIIFLRCNRTTACQMLCST